MEQSVGFEMCPGLESFLLGCRNYLILSQGFYLTLGHLVPGKKTHSTFLFTIGLKQYKCWAATYPLF